VLDRVVKYRLGGVEAEAIEMILGDPMLRVREDEFADGFTAIVDGIAPVGLHSFGEVARRKRGQIISVRAKVVVHDIEDDAEAEVVGAIDEAAHVVGPAVQPGRGEQIDAVIPPAEAAGKIRYGHDFDHRDAGRGEFGKLACRRFPCAFAREGPDVKLVDNLAF
jgi:hypothetical protein